MSDGYRPTMSLRFIQRHEPAPDNPQYTRAVRILQQKWESIFDGYPGVWRDVPLEEDKP